MKTEEGMAISALLRSPCCLAPLLEDGQKLACHNCMKTYPVVEGIPVLINDAGE